MESKFQIPVQGGHIATYSIGNGPTVIFLHGGPGDTHHYMKRMAEPLFMNFQCIFFDQRGTGESNNFVRNEDQFRLPFLFDDLLAVQNHYASGPVMLVGHSWGAIYALFASIQYPERFKKVALLNMGPLDSEMNEATTGHLLSTLTPEEQDQWSRLRSERTAARDVGNLDLVQKADKEMMSLRVKSWVFQPNLRDIFLNDYFQDPPPDREVNKWIWESAVGWFKWEKLKTVKAETWICVGVNDAVPVAQAKRVVELVPHASLTVFERCGHIPWLEHPTEFYRQLTEFLNE